MPTTKIQQGPWTRVRPLQRDELDPYTHAGMRTAEVIWGIRNNLCKVMAYCPRLMQTEVEYANSFIFDPPIFRGDRQESGFNDRFLKELVISRTALANRSRYSVTHHGFMGMALFGGAGRAEEAHQKYLHLHEHEKHPEVYTERERVVLDYTVNVAQDAHLVSDEEFQTLRRVLRDDDLKDPRLSALSAEDLDRHVTAQIVELTWLIGHYCLLNRWFTALEVPDETDRDEDNFLAAYQQAVPADVRQRNEAVLHDDLPRRNVQLMRDYLACWGRGDVEAASQFWADDVELVVNGRNPMSGTYRGKAAYREYVRKLYALVAGRATLVTVYGNFADEHRAVNLIRVRFERPGKKPVEIDRTTVFRIEGGKIKWEKVFDDDQYAFDEFLSE
jgi:ketosteroid isomerase-like protein/alkylhydroperoxidase family enzyme